MIGPAQIRLELKGALERPAHQLLVSGADMREAKWLAPEGLLLELRERPTR